MGDVHRHVYVNDMIGIRCASRLRHQRVMHIAVIISDEAGGI